jgi:hypothetical protein
MSANNKIALDKANINLKIGETNYEAAEMTKLPRSGTCRSFMNVA